MQMRRPSGALLASLIVHAVVGMFFVQALVMERPLFDVFNFGRTQPEQPEEAVRYVTLGTPGAPVRPGLPPPAGNGRLAPPPPPLVAPAVIPDEIPPIPDVPTPDISPLVPSTGPLIGGNGVLSGIQPHYGDGRLWGAPPGVRQGPPPTPLEAMRGATHDEIKSYNDSMRVAGRNTRAPGDWTVNKGGQKFGVDPRYIRLGPVSIPTAVLALLPLNITGNPTTMERERNIDAMRRDIDLHAQQAANESAFQDAVRALRARKDRERAERLKKEREQKGESGETSDEDKPPAEPERRPVRHNVEPPPSSMSPLPSSPPPPPSFPSP
jgi:hypothetical protein